MTSNNPFLQAAVQQQQAQQFTNRGNGGGGNGGGLLPGGGGGINSSIYQQPLSSLSTSSMGGPHDLSLAGNFGLANLMGLIHRDDPDRASLSLGVDLSQTLNLNDSSNGGNAHISSLWDDAPRDPMFSLPMCYPRMSSVRADILEKLPLETLFVCFYSMPRDVYQTLAAQELINRGWRFHEASKMWFSAKSGSLVVFDVATWERRSVPMRPPEMFESGFLSADVVAQASRAALGSSSNLVVGVNGSSGGSGNSTTAPTTMANVVSGGGGPVKHPGSAW